MLIYNYKETKTTERKKKDMKQRIEKRILHMVYEKTKKAPKIGTFLKEYRQEWRAKKLVGNNPNRYYKTITVDCVVYY